MARHTLFGIALVCVAALFLGIEARPNALRLQWAYPTGGQVQGSPAVLKDGTVIIGDNDGNLYAMSPKGKQIWRFGADGWVFGRPVVTSEGVIIFGSADTNVYAILPPAEDGERPTLLWKHKTGGYVFGSPTLSRDESVVYIGSDDSTLRAINTTDGTALWVYHAQAEVRSTPLVGDDGTVYVGAQDGFVRALSPQDGGMVWNYLTQSKRGMLPRLSSLPWHFSCGHYKVKPSMSLGHSRHHHPTPQQGLC
jgi:outer membrane protein assembly factor BamB